MLIALMNIIQKQNPLPELFRMLLDNNCADYVGLLLKTNSTSKLHCLRSNIIADELLKQIVDSEMYWCIPYFKGLVQDINSYEKIISLHRQNIIINTVKGEFRLSPLFHEAIRYNSEEAFFIENLPDYLGVLLEVSTNKYIIQRLLIEVCSTGIFRKVISAGKMALIYKLFKNESEWPFYLDAFYNALRYDSHKNQLKIAILDDLEAFEAHGGQQTIANFGGGILKKKKKAGRCAGTNCKSRTNWGACESCRLNEEVPFEDFIVVLRCVLAEQQDS